ncbi:hypothetical protein MY8738_009456 [Beauveria namnaoensis]
MRQIAAAVFAAAGALASVNASLPAVVEFDLVFPRDNETYSLSPIFPLVFGIQNPELVSFMGDDGPLVDIRVRRKDNYNYTLSAYHPRFTYTQGSNNTKDQGQSHVYYVYLDMRPSLLSEGTWEIGWDVAFPHCSRVWTLPNTMNWTLAGNSQTRFLSFAISADGKAPDITSPKDWDAECFEPQTQYRASAGFNVTDILSLEGQSGNLGRLFEAGMHSCLETSADKLEPEINHCASRVDSDAAESISAALLATACSKTAPLASCPSKSAAQRTTLSTAGLLAVVFLAGFAFS